MQAEIDRFINDFYADLDSRVLSRQLVGDYFTEDCVLSHFGELSKGHAEIEAWYDSLKAGFDDSVHMIKKVEYKLFDEIYAVRADAVWTASFRNIEKNSKIMYKADIRMDIIQENGSFLIKKYRSAAV